ncbi:MAG: tetratricopeptide repeat protein [Taibaiella sp.]|nr:tetratricopeptide repeat protein [Taibaiella sp.]
MKCAWMKFFPLLFVIALFISCDSNKTPPADRGGQDPVFQEDPALKVITADIEKTPGNAALYFERGQILRKMKLDSLALRDYKKAVTLDSGKATYYSAVGDLLFENKDITGSIEWIQKALNLQPDDRKAHLKIAKLFFYLQDYPRAFEEINIVLRKNVYDPEAYFLKGMIYKDIKDTAKAISNFQTAVQVAPDYRDAIIQLGLMHSDKNENIALRYLENAYSLDTFDVFPVFARGVYYQKNNDFVNAKNEYRRCILEDRHYTDAYFNLGYLLMQEDSTAKAWRQYDMAIKTDPSNPAAYYNRGLCSEMMDSIKNAARDYNIALKMDPGYAKPKEALKRLGIK